MPSGSAASRARIYDPPRRTDLARLLLKTGRCRGAGPGAATWRRALAPRGLGRNPQGRRPRLGRAGASLDWARPGLGRAGWAGVRAGWVPGTRRRAAPSGRRPGAVRERRAAQPGGSRTAPTRASRAPLGGSAGTALERKSDNEEHVEGRWPWRPPSAPTGPSGLGEGGDGILAPQGHYLLSLAQEQSTSKAASPGARDALPRGPRLGPTRHDPAGLNCFWALEGVGVNWP